MVIVAMVPLGLLSLHLHKTAWENSWREVNEKHLLLSQNLAAPISIYVEDHKNALALLVCLLNELDQPSATRLQNLLRRAAANLQGFYSLALVDRTGQTQAIAVQGNDTPGTPNLFSDEPCFLMVKKTGEFYISNIKKSPLTQRPTIIIALPIFDSNGKFSGALLGELRIELIEKLRRNIRFGKLGHSAIVDARGRVIAHPNAAWMTNMRDLSDWPIVKSMMAGKSGVTEFYSSHMKQDMVAGFSAVPGIGWGVMVPQPKSEIEAQVQRLMMSYYTWGLAGLSLALLLAMLLARWITHPIHELVTASNNILNNDAESSMPEPPGDAPQEVQLLARAMKTVVSNLQNSRKQVEQLNASLQQRVDEATKKLQYANEQLRLTAQSDHLTSLANRRFFEAELSQELARHSEEHVHVCLMLIDIDNFKSINDRYGHAAGDIVLTQVARVLDQLMRPTDLVARYAGDEFVSHLQCRRETALKRAEEIRQQIEKLQFEWHRQTFNVTVSIGVYCENLAKDANIQTVIDQVDTAMYEAKKLGKNCVKEYNGKIINT